MLKNAVLLVFTIFFLASCSKYDKILKSDDFEYKYVAAKKYYEEESYIKASTILESIESLYRATNKADSISYMLGMCNFQMQDYLMGAYYFNNLATMYPSSPYVEDADYMIAFCLLKSTTPPELDQQNTKDALEYFRNFLRKHPESEKAYLARNYIIELQDKLIEKSFLNAKLYYDLERYKASVVALNNSLIDFPETKYREEILYLLVKSNFLLAENSIDSKKSERYQNTVDSYYSFVEEYPESEHKKEAEKIFEKASKYTNKGLN